MKLSICGMVTQKIKETSFAVNEMRREGRVSPLRFLDLIDQFQIDQFFEERCVSNPLYAEAYRADHKVVRARAHERRLDK